MENPQDPQGGRVGSHCEEPVVLDAAGQGRQSAGMSRQLRIVYAGAMYHVMSRGNAGAEIRDDPDCEQRLHWLARTVDDHGWRVHAFVLMS